MAWLEGINKIALNIPPYSGSFDPNAKEFEDHLVFVRESGVTETSTGSPTGYIYLNGIKYGDGFDTYISNVQYLDAYDESHPYSLEFNYVDGSKDTFYVSINDIETIYQLLDSMSGTVDEKVSKIEKDIYVLSSEIQSVSSVVDLLSASTDYRFEVIEQEISAVNEYHTAVETDIYDRLDKTIISATYVPYSESESGSTLQLITYNGDTYNIHLEDIDSIIETYQPRIDPGFKTEDKSVSGAVNELLDRTYEAESAVSSMSSIVYNLFEKVEYLENLIGNAYFSSKYANSVLTLYKFNGDSDSWYITGSTESGSPCCCCPITDVANRVTDIEDYIIAHSGDCHCKDLEKRVMTLENEVNLDSPIKADYTVEPPVLTPILGPSGDTTGETTGYTLMAINPKIEDSMDLVSKYCSDYITESDNWICPSVFELEGLDGGKHNFIIFWDSVCSGDEDIPEDIELRWAPDEVSTINKTFGVNKSNFVSADITTKADKTIVETNYDEMLGLVSAFEGQLKDIVIHLKFNNKDLQLKLVFEAFEYGYQRVVDGFAAAGITEDNFDGYVKDKMIFKGITLEQFIKNELFGQNIIDTEMMILVKEK